MIIDVIIAVFAGILFGIITGMIPGIHINLVAVFLVSIAVFLPFHPVSLGVFIVAMATAHTFLDALPSIFLGMPSSDMALAVMPGHKLLIQGRGHEAVKLTVIGSLLCLIATVILVPFLIYLFPLIYFKTKNSISTVLLVVVLIMLAKEKGMNKKFWAVLVFLFSGILGMIVWVSTINQSLFPLLSGLFGVSTLVISLFRNVEIPTQMISEDIRPSTVSIIIAVIAGTLSGTFTGLFPGVGASQAAVIATTLYRKAEEFSYLIIVGGVNTVNFLVGIITFYTLDKARNGGVVALSEIVGSINLTTVILFISTALLVGGISTILALKFSSIFSRIIHKINYSRICLLLIVFISILAFVISGPLGFAVLIAASSIGIIPHLVHTGKRHCMGCLLLPVIVYFMMG